MESIAEEFKAYKQETESKLKKYKEELDNLNSTKGFIDKENSEVYSQLKELVKELENNKVKAAETEKMNIELQDSMKREIL